MRMGQLWVMLIFELFISPKRGTIDVIRAMNWDQQQIKSLFIIKYDAISYNP